MTTQNSGASVNARLTPSFKHLSDAATTLNCTSNELGTVIGTINYRLNQLKIGVPAWITFHEQELKNGEATFQLGYARVPRDSWGIVIRTVVDDDDDPNITAFNDVPRDLRLKAIHKLPDLIEALIKEIEARIAELAPGVELLKEFEKTLTQVVGISDEERMNNLLNEDVQF